MALNDMPLRNAKDVCDVVAGCVSICADDGPNSDGHEIAEVTRVDEDETVCPRFVIVLSDGRRFVVAVVEERPGNIEALRKF